MWLSALLWIQYCSIIVNEYIDLKRNVEKGNQSAVLYYNLCYVITAHMARLLIRINVLVTLNPPVIAL